MASLTPEQIAKLTGIVPRQLHDAVMAVIADCEEKLKANTSLHPAMFDAPVTVSYDLVGTTAGKAHNGRHIQLNLSLLLDPATRDEMLYVTLPHEYAHIIQRRVWPKSTSHGLEWKYLMNKLGLKAERCHDMPVEPARKHLHVAEFACTGCGRLLRMKRARYNRYLNGTNYRCGHCGSPIEFRREL